MSSSRVSVIADRIMSTVFRKDVVFTLFNKSGLAGAPFLNVRVHIYHDAPSLAI